MTVTESKGLKKGNRVYWRGDATDSGIITEMSWDAVMIAWDSGQVATVHHGDMREIQRAPAKPILVLGPIGVLLLAQSRHAIGRAERRELTPDKSMSMP